VSQNLAPDSRLRQYLLDALDERDRRAIEEQYFSDDEAFEDVLAAEDELIDDYVTGRLSDAERERFDEAFLTTDRRRNRVAFARGFRQVVTRARVDNVSAEAAVGEQQGSIAALAAWFRAITAQQWATAAVTLVLVVSAAWLALDRARLQQHIAATQAANRDLTDRTEALQRQLEGERRRVESLVPERGRADGPLVASFLLTPRLVRGGADTNVVRVTSATALVRLQLELEAATHPRYRPVLETVGGEQVWSQAAVPANVPSGTPIVTIELPASLLANRDYVLTLHGEDPAGKREEVAAYAFRVARE
jgi:hypothetical protein